MAETSLWEITIMFHLVGSRFGRAGLFALMGGALGAASAPVHAEHYVTTCGVSYPTYTYKYVRTYPYYTDVYVDTPAVYIERIRAPRIVRLRRYAPARVYLNRPYRSYHYRARSLHYFRGHRHRGFGFGHSFRRHHRHGHHGGFSIRIHG